jgi:hypothetical protein
VSFLVSLHDRRSPDPYVVDPSFELNSPPTAAEPYRYHIAEAFDQVPTRFPAKVDRPEADRHRRHWPAGAKTRSAAEASP